jgi:hypothetical protein
MSIWPTLNSGFAMTRPILSGLADLGQEPRLVSARDSKSVHVRRRARRHVEVDYWPMGRDHIEPAEIGRRYEPKLRGLWAWPQLRNVVGLDEEHNCDRPVRVSVCVANDSGGVRENTEKSGRQHAQTGLLIDLSLERMREGLFLTRCASDQPPAGRINAPVEQQMAVMLDQCRDAYAARPVGSGRIAVPEVEPCHGVKPTAHERRRLSLV